MTNGETLRPESPEMLREIVARAARDGVAIEAMGGGTKRDVGRPNRGNTLVDISAMKGVVDYEPTELVLTVRPGTPLVEIETLLGERGQMLAFEPWDHGAIFGRKSGATIGGIVAAGIAGPRRVSAGGARDHLLGFEAVSGRGEIFKGGGKVVKNVTGYDMPKIIAGSWGQLAIMTELTLKVLPKPRSVVTIWIRGLSTESAVDAMAHAMGSPCAVAAAAHTPKTADNPSTTAFRLEGITESVLARIEELGSVLAIHGDCTAMTPEGSTKFWRDVAAGDALAESEALWRAHVAPSRAGALTTALQAFGARYILDWAGAALWIGAPSDRPIRSVVNAAGGHAMLIRAPAESRYSIPIREPEVPAVAALSARVKKAFDPAGILDPRRFS